MCTTSNCFQSSHHSVAVLWELILLAPRSIRFRLYVYRHAPRRSVAPQFGQLICTVGGFGKFSTTIVLLWFHVYSLFRFSLDNSCHWSNDILIVQHSLRFFSRGGVMLSLLQLSGRGVFCVPQSSIFLLAFCLWGLSAWPVVDCLSFLLPFGLRWWEKRSPRLQSNMVCCNSIPRCSVTIY